MFYDGDVIFIYSGDGLSKADCSIEQLLCYWWIKIYDIKLDQIMLTFLVDGVEPFDDVICIFPLIEWVTIKP